MEPMSIPFKVSKHWGESRNEEFFLMLTKPNKPEWDKGTGSQVEPEKPIVSRSLRTEEDGHAFHIMHNLNHKNIVWMKALGRFSNWLYGFVEPCNGPLYPTCWNVLIDQLQTIPSPTCQEIVRELIEVIDFLRLNKTCHGRLNWDTTLR